MKIALVTGATGCVGRNLVDVLRAASWDVIVLHRKSSDLTRLAGTGVRFQEVDLHDLADVRRAIPENVNALFHVAGNTSHWSREQKGQWKDNVLATRNLVQAALEKKVERFIFTSTGATRFYQETDEELAKKIPVPYVRTKRLSELEVYAGIAKGLQAIILHPIIVIGEYDYNSYGQIFDFIRSGKSIAFPGKITFCHAMDVAKAHLSAYETGRPGERYVLGGTYAPWQECFQAIADVQGTGTKIAAAPTLVWKVIGHASELMATFTRRKPQITPALINLVKEEPEISVYDQNRTLRDLGYSSRSLETMVRDCYDWLVREKRIEGAQGPRAG